MTQTLTPLRSEFTFAALAVDVVILSVIQNKLSVLLMKNTKDPFKDMLTLPGGLVTKDETLDEAVERHMHNKINMQHIHSEQVYTFGSLHRDPRSRVVAVSYLSLLPPDRTSLYDDPKNGLQWMPFSELPKLAYDHNEIVQTAVERLKSKLEYTNVVYSLLPREFTLSELQSVYETILERSLDKRNFQRKILSLHIIKRLKKQRSGEANRPAALYSFLSHETQLVAML